MSGRCVKGEIPSRKIECYSKCQLPEIEMTDPLTSSEFVVFGKSANERFGRGVCVCVCVQMEALGAN